MVLDEISENEEGIFRSKTAQQMVQTALFVTLAVLLFYFTLDTVGLETGTLPSLFVGLALGAAAFLHVFEIPYSLFLFLIVITAPGVVVAREHLLHGPAGVASPVTPVFMALIVAALLFSGGLSVAARRLV